MTKEQAEELEKLQVARAREEMVRIVKHAGIVLRFGCGASMIFWLAFQAGLVYWIWRQ